MYALNNDLYALDNGSDISFLAFPASSIISSIFLRRTSLLSSRILYTDFATTRLRLTLISSILVGGGRLLELDII